jgi:hypothetical protein
VRPYLKIKEREEKRDGRKGRENGRRVEGREKEGRQGGREGGTDHCIVVPKVSSQEHYADDR